MSEPTPTKRKRNQIGIAPSDSDLARLDALRKIPGSMPEAARSAMALVAFRMGLDALEGGKAAKPRKRRKPRAAR